MSHSSNEPIDHPEFADLLKDLREQQRGAAHTFPDGKMDRTDEGALMLAVTNKDGKVLIHFPHPVTWFGMTPLDARNLAKMLLHHSVEASAPKPEGKP